MRITEGPALEHKMSSIYDYRTLSPAWGSGVANLIAAPGSLGEGIKLHREFTVLLRKQNNVEVS